MKTSIIRIQLTLTTLSLAFGLAACGKLGGGTSATLKVGQLKASGSSSSSGRLRGDIGLSKTYSAADLVPSSSAFSFATIDGLKIQIKSVSLKKEDNTSEATLADWSSAPKTLEIGGDTNAISISESVTLTPGHYSGGAIRFDNSYSVKAYCQTANKFVYTSATGIKTLNSAPTSLPADYDYYSYPFAYVTTAQSPTDTTDDAYEGNSGSYDITSSSDQQVALLVDNSFLITCYDGTLTSLNGASGSLSPFGWGNNYGHQTSEFFPAATPAFGMSYVPIFLWVGSASETIPTAETYIIGATSSAVTSASVDYSQVAIATAAFKSDGSLLALRGRINDSARSTTDVLQMFDQKGDRGTDGTYTLYNGEWQCNEGYTNCGIIQDRIHSGFKQASDYITPITVTVTDGPDCGKTGYFPGHPEWGNRYRSCGPIASTLYWRKMKR